jgi:hypothetical protein
MNILWRLRVHDRIIADSNTEAQSWHIQSELDTFLVCRGAMPGYTFRSMPQGFTSSDASKTRRAEQHVVHN